MGSSIAGQHVLAASSRVAFLAKRMFTVHKCSRFFCKAILVKAVSYAAVSLIPRFTRSRGSGLTCTSLNDDDIVTTQD